MADSSERPIDLLGYGVAAVDEMIEVETFPQRDTKVDLAAHSTQCGGICINALVAAARLGARAHFAGALGDDPLARIVIDGARAAGLTVTTLDDRPAARRDALRAAGPSHAFILVDRADGARTILMNKQRVIDLAPEDLPDDLLRQTRALYVDAWHLDASADALPRARALGVITIADFEEHDVERVRALCPWIDHLILPLDYARRLTGEREPAAILTALDPASRACTVVTRGADGCAAILGTAPHDVQHVPARTDLPIVDTTGCGDTFHGAYIALILAGAPPLDAIRGATVAAALSAGGVGALAAQPDVSALGTAWPDVGRYLPRR